MPDESRGDAPPIRASVLWLEAAILLAVCFSVYIVIGTAPMQLTDGNLYRLAWLNNIGLVVQVIVLRRSFGSMTAPLVLYAVLLALFTSGQLILFSLGIEPAGADVLNREPHDAVALATAFYLTAFTFFCAGCVLANELKRARPIRVRPGPIVEDWQNALLSVGGVSIGVGVLPFLVSNYHNFRVILSQGYSGYYAEDARLDSPLLSLSYLFITGLVFIGCAGRARYRQAAAAMLVVVAVIRLAAGDRGEGMIYLLSAYLVHRQSARSTRNSRVGFILIVVFALVAIPAIGLLRQSFGGGSASDLSQLLQQENPLVGSLDTVGATLFPLVSMIQLVPGTVHFAGGSTYLTSIALLIPALLRVGPIAELASNPLYASPGKWLMNYLGSTSGQGFTPFAESYLNFGWWGGCVAMLVFGIICALVLRLPRAGSIAWPVKTAFVLATFALLGFTVRGSFNLVVPFSVHYILLPGFALALTANGFRKARERSSKQGAQ